MQSVRDIQGNIRSMSNYKDKVLLIANLASQCGATEDGYADLNALHERYAERGLEVLGFPCNQFGGQEPGNAEEIQGFATSMGARFKLFSKIDVNGPDANPLYKLLKGQKYQEADDCIDDDQNCRYWAESGECARNPKYMLTSCRLSCEQCQPLYPFAGDVLWNFEYFLVSRDATVVARYRTGTRLTESKITALIEAELDKVPGAGDQGHQEL